MAQAKLWESYNDVDIFVEDVATTNMYVKLFQRMVPRKKIGSVFALGARMTVVDYCARDQAPRNRKRLYLVDGDLDLISGLPKPRLRHLHRLQVYCSENLLLSEEAVVAVAMQRDASVPDFILRGNLRASQLLTHCVELLLPLFVVYGVVRRLGLGIPTVSFTVRRLLEDPHDPWSLSRRLIRARIREVIKQIYADVSVRRYKTAKHAVRRNLRKATDSEAFISGKAYLLPLIRLQMAHVTGMQCPSTELVVRMAEHAPIDKDRALLRAVRRVFATPRIV